MNTNTYADFLLSFIKMIEKEQARAIELDVPRLCYLCNTLDNPGIPNAFEWKTDNAHYIDILKESIKEKMKRFDREEQKKATKINSRHKPISVGTLSVPLREQYGPEGDAYTIRLLWLKDLYKYHKARGTSSFYHETRNWLKLPSNK